MNVSTVSELIDAVNLAEPDTTILVADGIYNLAGSYLRISKPGVVLRSASGNREAVILNGNYLTTEIVQIVASDVTVANLTLREAYNHPVHIMSTESLNTENTFLYNLYIIDPGQQAVKINPAAAGYFADNGLIACSLIELTDIGRTSTSEIIVTPAGSLPINPAVGWLEIM